MSERKKTLTLSGSGTSVSDIIASQVAENYASFSLQVSGTFVGTVGVQVSNDGTNWLTARLQDVQNATSITGTLSAPGMARGPLAARFVKVVILTYTSGTPTATLFLSPDPFTSMVKST